MGVAALRVTDNALVISLVVSHTFPTFGNVTVTLYQNP